MIKYLILAKIKSRNSKVDVSYRIQPKDILTFLRLCITIGNELEGTKTLVHFEELITMLTPKLKSEEIESLIEGGLVTNEIEQFLKYLKPEYYIGNKKISDSLIKDIKVGDNYNYISDTSKLVDKFYEFRQAIRASVDAGIFYRENTNKVDKVELIGVCYLALKNYNLYFFKKDIQNNISQYLMNLITGLIIIKIYPSAFPSFQDYSLKKIDLKKAEIEDVIAPHTRLLKGNILKDK